MCWHLVMGLGGMKEWRKFILEATQTKEGKEHILVGDWRWGGHVHGDVRAREERNFLLLFLNFNSR